MNRGEYGRLAGDDEAKSIINLAQQFDRNLNGKSFLICFGEKSLRFIEITFSAKNFNHLIGIDKNNCRISPHELYQRAVKGSLKPQDLGYSIAPKFRMKTIAAKFLNEFGSTASHVSAIDKRASKVNAEIWISGSTVGFAIGALHVGSRKSGPISFIPTSLQLLDQVDLNRKSLGAPVPIVAMFSRRNNDLSYSTIEYKDDALIERHSVALESIMLSCCNEEALRKNYPETCSQIFDRDLEPLDSIYEAVEGYSKETEHINARRREIEAEVSK